MKLLEEIDELLAFLENTAHGAEGRSIAEIRGKIQSELTKNSAIVQDCACKTPLQWTECTKQCNRST